MADCQPEREAAWAAVCYAAGAVLWAALFNVIVAAGFRLDEDLELAFETYGFVLYIALFCVFLHARLGSVLPRQDAPEAGGLRLSRALQATLYVASFAGFLTLSVSALMYAFGGGHAIWSAEEIVKEVVVIGLTALWIYVQVKNVLAIDWRAVSAAVASNGSRPSVPLQSWMPVAAFVLLGIGIANTGHFLLGKYKGEITRDMQQLLTTMSAFKADRIAEWRAEQLRDGESLAADAYLGRAFADWARSGYATGPARQALAQRLTALVGAYGYEAAFIIDAGGQVRLGSHPPAALPTGYGRKLAAEALIERRVQLSDVHAGGEGGRHLTVMDILVPLAAPAAGVLYVRIDTRQAFMPILRPMPPRLRSGETFLARSENGEIVYLNDLLHRPGSALDFRISLDKRDLLAAMAAMGAEGIVEGVDYRDRPSIGAARRVPGTDWLLISKIDREELFAPVHERARKVGVVVLLFILGAGVAIFLWWRQLRGALLVEQYKMELERRTLARRNESLMMQANDSIFLFDAEGGLIEANIRAEERYGYTPAEFLRRKILDLCPPEAGALCAGRIGALGEEGVVFETEHYGKDQARFPVEVSARLIDTEGTRVGQAIVRDISERKRAEAEIVALNADLERRVLERTAELEGVNRELKAFSSSLSHDLRAPLRSILGFSRVVREDCASELGICGLDHLDRVIAAGERMDRLIEGMLKLFQVGIHGEIDRKPVDLAAMARDILETLRANEPDRVVECVIGETVTAIGDPALLRDVLENLIGNAWKYSSRRRAAKIEFGARRGENGQAVFYVGDNGAGFDMQFVDKLFKPFQRLHRADEFPGSGIGLATVARILWRHGGRIWADANVGGGATFHFTIEAG